MNELRSGRDHYARLYESDVAMEAEWLRRGAAEKANSVESLLRRHAIAPRVLLELGCGTGALIQECQRRGLAREYVALDYSAEALRHLRETSRGIEIVQADLATADLAARGAVDVVVVSHVVEHLEEPQSFLRAMVAKLDFAHAVIEVPLEDLPIVRWRHRGEDRRENRAGHVQFFTAATFTALLRSAGLEVVATRRYVPILAREDVRFLAAKNRLSSRERLRTQLTASLLPRLTKPLWSLLCHAHFAVLCRKATAGRSGEAGRGTPL